MTARPKTIVMASSNAGKIREISRLLENLGVEVVAQSELRVTDAVESGTTFVENSLIKAQHACDATGLAAIADDSGLIVDALDGAPGVYSARYAGDNATDDDNIEKLLEALQHVAAKSRGAAFHCAATLVMPGQARPLIAKGEWRGSILTSRQGDGGFGYDPVFLDPESGTSAAELSAREKNERSHRGQALTRLVALMEREFS